MLGLLCWVLAAVLLVCPGGVAADEPGSVLVLGAGQSVPVCVADSYGSGVIVKIDDDRNVAYILTAGHVVAGAERLFVLYDRMSFPFEYFFDLKSGVIPVELAAALVAKGHPEPTSIRGGLPPRTQEEPAGNTVYFNAESLVLSGAGHEYLALPQTEHLELYHILPATLVRESTDDLDLALLAVYAFPHYDDAPVLYLDDTGTIPPGTAIVTSGCNCGQSDGISQVELQAEILATEAGFLSYASPLVHPGFAGGPVLKGDYVIAMNTTGESGDETVMQARLASTFKTLVDDWIGLQRMRIDLVIDSPDGAKDGIVSTDQVFLVKSSARLDPHGQVLAPRTPIEISIPDHFGSEDARSATLEQGGDLVWSLTAPAVIHDPVEVALWGQRPDGADPDSLAAIAVGTEQGTRITGVVVKRPPHGAKLFLEDDLIVAIRFEQSGTRLPEIDGDVVIDVKPREFEILSGDPSQPLVLDRTMVWELRAQDVTRNAPISFKTEMRSLDRNGKPIEVVLPDTTQIHVLDEWKFRAYVGLGRLSVKEDLGVEIEIGYKFRRANLLQKGIPLQLGFAVGAGIDSLFFEDVTDPGVLQDEAMIIDYRYWGSVGAAFGFGSKMLSLDLGYIFFPRNVITDVPNIYHDLERPTDKSVFLQTGLEYLLAGRIGFLGGARFFLDLDDTELFLQFRIGNGK